MLRQVWLNDITKAGSEKVPIRHKPTSPRCGRRGDALSSRGKLGNHESAIGRQRFRDLHAHGTEVCGARLAVYEYLNPQRVRLLAGGNVQALCKDDLSPLGGSAPSLGVHGGKSFSRLLYPMAHSRESAPRIYQFCQLASPAGSSFPWSRLSLCTPRPPYSFSGFIIHTPVYLTPHTSPACKWTNLNQS